MFVRERVRETKKGKVAYAYLVENRWNPIKKKYQQIIVHCLGRVDRLPTDGTIEKMITAMDRWAGKRGFSALSQGLVVNNIQSGEFITADFDYGEIVLVKQVLKNLSFDQILKNIHESTPKTKISREKFQTATEALIAYHLHPLPSVSERATYNWYQNKLFLKNKKSLSLMDFYRSLDVLIKNKDAIEKQYYFKNQNLFNLELDLILFDTTSIYYYDGEEKIKEKSILQYGFSKDGKSNLKQVIVGVLMTKDGKPFAHEVFPGNKSDMKSFPEIIRKVKTKYNIKRIIFVADRGMVSEENLTLIEEEGMEYILGVKMRRLSPVLKSSLLPVDTESMEKIKDNLYVTDFPLTRLTEKEQDKLIDDLYDDLDMRLQSKEDKDKLKQRILKRRMIICFNPSVAAEEKQKREYFKKIIKNKIKYKTNKSWFVKNGYSKYVKIDKLDISLNENKLNQEALYDGVWILTTNCSDTISSKTVSLAYKSLQFVERGFRDLKSHINIRPIFHFKEERILAHVFLAFIVLIVKWYILNTVDPSSQEEGLRFIEAFLALKAIEVDKNIPLYVRTELDENTIQNLKTLGMKMPDKVLLDPRKKPNKPPTKPGRPKKINKNQHFLL